MTAAPDVTKIAADMREKAQAAEQERLRVEAGDDRGEKLWASADVVHAFYHTASPAHVIALVGAFEERGREIERLREREAELLDDRDDIDQACSHHEARADEAERRIAELVEALRPFAETAAAYGPEWDDDTCVDEEGFCLGSLRRAARLISPEDERRARAVATGEPSDA